MKRFWLVSLVIFTVLMPFIIVIANNFDSIKKQVSVLKYSTKHTVGPQYSIVSKVPAYAPKIVDSSFLDYIMAEMNIFEKDAIVDPSIYGISNIKNKRYTVSKVQIELVPTIQRFLLGTNGENDFAGRGAFVVRDDTLIIQVSINTDALPKGGTRQEYVFEDTFLDTALQVLVYAKGSQHKRLDTVALTKLKKNIEEYLYSGIFARPIIIQKKSE